MRLIDANKLKITDTWALVEKDPENDNTENNNAFTFAPLKCVLLSDIEKAPTVETERPQGERAERALSIIDRLRTDGHINNKEQGTLRRAILLPERPHGEWITKGQDIYCSICNQESAYNEFGASKFSNYCPTCGANMRTKNKIDTL